MKKSFKIVVVLEGMQESENPFVEEIKIDHKLTSDDARGHQH